MANKGFVNGLLNTLPADMRKVLNPAFEHVMDTWKLGAGQKATNAAWYRFTATTPATANTEFSVEHGLNQVPSLLIPVVPLDSVGNACVPLTVSRVADGRRVYLQSSSTGAAICFYLEVALALSLVITSQGI